MTFSTETWRDAIDRHLVRPPDRLVQTLLERPELESLVVANPPRSALVTASKFVLRQRQPPLHTGPGTTSALVQPLRLRRQQPYGIKANERIFRRYDRRLARAAARLGMERPPIVTFDPLVAGFCPTRWSGPVVYYARDDWTEHPAYEQVRPVYEEAYHRIRRRGIAVAAVSEELLARVGPEGAGIVIPNGIDPPEWGRREHPSDTVPGVARPLMVYAGTLDDRLDPEALTAICDQYPDGKLLLVGPLLAAETLAPVLARPNVEVLHPPERARVVSLIAAADVCLLPHRRTPLTEAMNPLKLYEYLAAGIPVAASDLSGSRRIHPKVILTRPGSGFAGAVATALEDGPMTEAERRAFLAANSWEERHRQLFAFLKTL